MSIYKKQSEDPMNFDSAQDFLKYYNNNQKELDSIHTRSLNLKYKINGHTIGRKQGKLILYPAKNNVNDDNENEVSLEEKYNKLKDVVLELIKEIDLIKQHIHL